MHIRKGIHYFLTSALLSLLLSIPYTVFAHTHTDDNHVYDDYMRHLIVISKENPRYPFAAMIIDNKTGEVLCEGVNSSSINPTYHGEMVAINNCAAKYPKIDWSNTTLITDAEPCSMCASAIIWAGIPKVVYGTSVPFFIEHGWKQINLRTEDVMRSAPFYKGTVIDGVLHEETDAVFEKAYK